MKLIRLNTKQYETDLYRIYPMHRFLDLLHNKRLTLVRPKLWSDPMESIIFESSFNVAGERSHSFKFKDNYFAQCWTLKYESYSLWNEYAPLQNGVRVRTKLGKLINQLSKHSNDDEEWFIGKVQYHSLKDMRKWIGINLPYSDHVCMKDIPYGHVYALLLKLNQYSHENEVRIIFNSKGDTKINALDLYENISIDPLTLFDRLLLDPRMPSNIYQVYRKELIAYGFKESQVIRSGLFDENILRNKLKFL